MYFGHTNPLTKNKENAIWKSEVSILAEKVPNRLLSIVVLLVILSFSIPSEWGFWGHRRINRMAVFTLPPEMISFYKKHIEYITEHAVDPDKRRYATKHEAYRHYIDIDHWGEYPFR